MAEINELNLDSISKEDLLNLLKQAYHTLDQLGYSLGDTLQGYDKDEWNQLDTEVTNSCLIDDVMAAIAKGLEGVVKVEYKPIFGPEDRKYVDDLTWDWEDEDNDDNDDEEEEDDEDVNSL